MICVCGQSYCKCVKLRLWIRSGVANYIYSLGINYRVYNDGIIWALNKQSKGKGGY
jgi:hypothetical protein